MIDTRTPIMYLHVTLKPGARLIQEVPRGWRALAYVIDGEVRFGRDGRSAGEGRMVLLGDDGDQVSMEAAPADRPADLLLVAGAPLNEPVVRYGPFVMNTEKEIDEAIEDYQNGRMGRIGA